jgi:hypothetical protein
MVRRREGAGVGAGARLVLGLVAMLALLAACSSGDDGDGGPQSAAGQGDVAAAEPTEVPGAAVARPAVTGPLTEGRPFGAMPSDLAERYGYVEEEYVLAGEATAYGAQGQLSEDGHWTVREAGTAEYRTRIVVRRPEDPDDFDGTVFVEWLNVTAGIDADPDFILGHPELLSHGSVHIGVSAQQVGVEGGGGLLPVPGAEAVRALKQWDPARYGNLSHPGDPYSYDIFSQAAQAVRRGDVDVLGGLEARHVIAIGESQSAARLVTYVNAVHPVAAIYDGFLVHSRGGGGAPLEESGSPIGEGTARIRTDLDEPVLQLLTESDLFGILGFRRAAQDDTDRLRTWEVAGTAHADRYFLEYGAQLEDDASAGGAGDLADQCGAINEGPQRYVVRAAIAALRGWVVDREPPAEAPRLEAQGEAIARDERGIALGGIRTPAVDAPISVLSGEAPPGGSVLCLLFGETRPFDAATLAALYPTHDDYVDAVTASADAAVAAGYLLPDDADEIIAEAEEASVPE